ncbi:unnamed protein product, partial [Parnassius apollo]
SCPSLLDFLSSAISNEKKIKLLSVMQDISYGIKIGWQESYLSELMKQLTDWIVQPMSEPQYRTIGHKSLTVLVNLCYGNLPAIYALMRTVDTKEFVVHLINLKDSGYGGVALCRLLDTDNLCIAAADDRSEPENTLSCLQSTLKFLTVLVNLDSYSLRCHHYQLICLCMKTSRICLPESLELPSMHFKKHIY